METFIEEYKDCHKGKTCAVLGGGTSLPYDLRSIPDVDYLFGVNQHSLILPLDYIVFVDKHMWKYVKDFDATFITRSVELPDSADKQVIRYRQKLWHNYSGALALAAADKMGFSKVYACGLDQYDRALDAEAEIPRYYWWEGPQTPQKQKDRKVHDNTRALLTFIKTLRQPNNVFFVSGRMKELHQ